MITRVFGDFNPLYKRFKIGDNGASEDRGTVNQSGHVLRKVLVDVWLMRETLCGFVSRFSVRIVRRVMCSRNNEDVTQNCFMRKKAIQLANGDFSWKIISSILTDNVDLEGIVDASQIIAHDARVIAAILGNKILQSQGPLGFADGTNISFWFLVVLQPRDVWPRIAHARAF